MRREIKYNKKSMDKLKNNDDIVVSIDENKEGMLYFH
jgi:hypothetical protein